MLKYIVDYWRVPKFFFAAKSYSLSAGQDFEVKIKYVDITHENFEAEMKTFEDNLTNMFDDEK